MSPPTRCSLAGVARAALPPCAARAALAATSSAVAPHRDIALASGFRAVQSTPLVNRAGHLVGVLSTHYPQPTTPPRRDLQSLSRFGVLAGESLSTLLNTAQVSVDGVH